MKRLLFGLSILLFVSAPVMAQVHFTPVEPTGLPYAVVVQNAEFDGETLVLGDEIAVFDGTLCVGAGVVGESWPLSLTAWQNDVSQGLEGFTTGNAMSFLVWAAENETEAEGVPSYLMGNGTFGYGVGTNISLLSAVSGGGGVPDFYLPETSHDFGLVYIGSQQLWQITITNIGDGVLNLLNAESDNNVFSISEPDDFTLDPEQSVIVDVAFTPVETGPQAGTITITSNDPDEPEVVLNLSGDGLEVGDHFDPVAPTGLPYAIVVQAAELNEETLTPGDEIGVFDGDLCVGAALIEGDWPVSITAWQADPSQELEGFLSGNGIFFRIWSQADMVELPAIPTYLLGNGTFGFGFGTNIGLLAATNETLGPDIHFPEPEHDFGEVVLGQQVTWVTVVQNLGDADLVISQTLTSNAEYTVSAPVTIPPQSATEMEISYSPTQLGESEGTITFVSNDPDEPEASIQVTGICVPALVPDIHIEETFHEFGNVILGETGLWMMQVANLGTAELTITSIYAEIADTFTVQFTDPILVMPEGTVEIPVTFAPVEFGLVMDRLHVISNDPDEEDILIDVQGRGVTLPGEFSLVAPGPDSLVSTRPLTFRWHQAENLDPGDEISYQLILAGDSDFTIPDIYLALQDTFFVLDAPPDDSTLFWKVRAVDTNSDSSRLSTEIWTFSVSIPDPPSDFDLLTPADSAEVDLDTQQTLEFLWEQSFDPDPDSEVRYLFNVQVTYLELFDTTLVYDGLSDTLLTLNLPDSLPGFEWPETLTLLWWVKAVSQGDTTESLNRHTLFVAPWSSVTHFSSLPMSYGIKSVYPNPFNPTATVVVGLPMAGELRVELFNLLGQRVALLAEGYQVTGHHRYLINGHSLASGVYFVRATSPGHTAVMQKVVLMR